MTGPRPRIALVGPRPDDRGGIAAFGAHLAAALSGTADVQVVGFRRLYPGWTRPGRLRAGSEPAGGPPGPLPWSPPTWRAAARDLGRFRPDLTVLQWWHPALAPCLRYLARRARRSGSRVAFVCHNPSPHEPFPGALVLTRRALATADRVFTLSRAAAEALRPRLPGIPVESLVHPPYRWPEPAEGARGGWRERIGPGSPVILFFGYVRPYKGLVDLLHAMPLVLARRPSATLVVAGPFLEPPGRYRSLADRLGVSGAVRLFPGYVPDEEAAALFAEADVVALPYRSATQSGVVPQALAAGKPVVATSVGGIPEALEGRGVLVPPRDPRALAQGILRALDRPSGAAAGGPMSWSRWAEALLREAALAAAEVAP